MFCTVNMESLNDTMCTILDDNLKKEVGVYAITANSMIRM